MLKNGRKDVWDMFIFSRWEMTASVLYTRTFWENITTAKALWLIPVSTVVAVCMKILKYCSVVRNTSHRCTRTWSLWYAEPPLEQTFHYAAMWGQLLECTRNSVVYKHQKIGKLVGMPVPGTMTSVSWETYKILHWFLVFLSSVIVCLTAVIWKIPNWNRM